MSETKEILSGDRRALARALSVLETGGEAAARLLDSVWARTGRARRIGLTGPPGSGKSTLVAGLVRAEREAGRTVGVVAVDPTSPFTGGALLGDRHRLGAGASDAGVFFRSFASRGAKGGLARAAPAALDLLDAAGFEVLLLETVGVGQTEVEVAGVADTVAVVLSPESGDAVQAMKAGLLEIADVFVVNKADREGATRMRTELELMLSLKASESSSDDGWQVPVLMTQASRCEGTEAVLDACLGHLAHLAEGGRAERRRQRLTTEVLEIFEEELMRRLRARSSDAPIKNVLADVAGGRTDPYRAALDLLGDESALAAILSQKDGGKQS